MQERLPAVKLLRIKRVQAASVLPTSKLRSAGYLIEELKAARIARAEQKPPKHLLSVILNDPHLLIWARLGMWLVRVEPVLRHLEE